MSSFAKWSSYASDAGSNSSVFSTTSSSSETSSDEEESILANDEATGRSSHLKRRKVPSMPTWSCRTLLSRLAEMEKLAFEGTTKESRRRPIVLLIDGYALDCTTYASEHPGGMAYMKDYSVSSKSSEEVEGKWIVRDASEVFNGGLNDHGWSAKEKMNSFRIAKILN